MGNEDKREKFGVYYIVRELTDRQTQVHSRVYLMECSVCGALRELRKCEAKKVTTCKHICTGGRVSVKHKTWKNKRIADVFYAMTHRCYAEKSKSYKDYGAKGIKICDEWMQDPSKFEEWALENGYKDDLTIDRIDSSKGYEPSNCRWIPRRLNSQLGGMAGNSYLNVDGVEKSSLEWSHACNVSHNVINRMRHVYGDDITLQFIRLRLQDLDRKMEKRCRHGWLQLYGLAEISNTENNIHEDAEEKQESA